MVPHGAAGQGDVPGDDCLNQRVLRLDGAFAQPAHPDQRMTDDTHPRELCSQYSGEDFQRPLVDQGITCSMSRRGKCWDSTAIESFFSTLKIERVFRSSQKTRDEAQAGVFDYIERFYNPSRRHLTLNGLSPKEFAKRSASLTVCP